MYRLHAERPRRAAEAHDAQAQLTEHYSLAMACARVPIADCFRLERLIGAEAAMEALQDGLRQRKVTVAELSQMVDALPSRRLKAVLDARSI